MKNYLKDIIDLTGCWEWAKAKSSAGYGQTRINNKLYYTHRLFYEQEYGFIPENLTIDHLCRNRACCNPNHLEVVTRKINNLRGNGWSGIKHRVTHCPQGHELAGSNLVKYSLLTGHRKCKTCKNARDKAYYYNRKGLAI